MGSSASTQRIQRSAPLKQRKKSWESRLFSGPSLLAALLMAPVSLLGASDVWAEECVENNPFAHMHRFGQQLITERSIAMLGTAGLVFPAMMQSGADAALSRLVTEEWQVPHRPEPVSVYGVWVVGAATILSYPIAVLTQDCDAMRVTSALLLALGSTQALSITMKFTFGREWPHNYPPDPWNDYSKELQPFQAGLGAWPSGHTASMFAIAAALRAANPEWGVWAWSGYPFAVGVGMAMWLGNHHWASDVVSGALMGEAIGHAAGMSLRKNGDAPTVDVAILPSPGGGMVSVAGTF